MRESQPSFQPFIRDRLTWLAYITLAYIGFSQSILGPLMPFLRDELHLNYTLGGFLSSTLAVGLIISGLTGDRLARHWGRRIIFWNGAIILALSAILLGLSRSFEGCQSECHAYTACDWQPSKHESGLACRTSSRFILPYGPDRILSRTGRS